MILFSGYLRHENIGHIFIGSPITTKFSVLRYKCLKRHLTDCFKEEEARGEEGVISQVHKWVK